MLLPPKPVDIAALEDSVRATLLALGQGDKAEVMENTPRRVAEMYLEVINPPNIDVDTDLKVFANPDRKHSNVIYVNDVHYVSICEHHLAPAFGVAHVAYIPDEHVVGYSKLKKGLNYLARQPTLNERLLTETLDFVEERLKPKGIALALRSVHCCIAERTNGPAQEIVTVAGFRGRYEFTDGAPDWTARAVALRDEFWRTVMANRPIFLGQ